MKWLRRLFIFVVVLILLALSPFIALEIYLQKPAHHPESIVMIEPGSSVAHIGYQLWQAHVIPLPIVFRLYVRMNHGADHALKAGEYVFADGMSPRAVYQKMVRGEFRTFEIRLIEGWNMRQMAEYLAKQPFVTTPSFADDFLIACRDPARLKALGVAAPSLEGFLFPDTYHITRPHNAGEIVDRLVSAFRHQYDAEIQARAAALGWNMLQVTTLASIIEKETGAAAERALVSAVFHNRLQKGMKLETDPTVVYGLTNYSGVIHKSDLENPHPYNTYVHPGLPPGPIANPGRACLVAAVNPANVPYLFFVSKNNGTHVFSETYADHAKAVEEFQR